MLMGAPWTVSREGDKCDSWKWHLMRRGQGEGKARRHQTGDKDTNDVQWRGRKNRSPAHTREHCLESGVQPQCRDMKEAAKQAANRVFLFQVDGQCVTCSKFGMRELGCRQKRTRRFSQKKNRACFRLSELKKVTNSPKQPGWLRGLTSRVELVDLLTALGRKEIS